MLLAVAGGVGMPLVLLFAVRLCCGREEGVCLLVVALPFIVAIVREVMAIVIRVGCVIWRNGSFDDVYAVLLKGLQEGIRRLHGDKNFISCLETWKRCTLACSDFGR